MKNFQRNLLILLALGLCCVCAWQWYLQAVQLQSIERLNEVIYKKSADIQDYTNAIRTRDDNISQLHDRVTQLKQAAASNDQWAIEEKREVARLLSAGDIISNELAQYHAAVTDLTNKLGEAFNAEKELAGQRDEFIRKLNASIKAQNDLTLKYNALVDRFNKLQASHAAPASASNQ